MLSDNIKNYRKENNLSQDELAEKLGVSRQSISLWETGQTQPTLENIMALAKIFNVSSDVLLDNIVGTDGSDGAESDGVAEAEPEKLPENNKKKMRIIIAAASSAVVIAVVLLLIFIGGRNTGTPDPENTISGDSTANYTTTHETKQTSSTTAVKTETAVTTGAKNAVQSDSTSPKEDNAPDSPSDESPDYNEPSDADNNNAAPVVNEPDPEPAPTPTPDPEPQPFDLFTYCKNFAIKIGNLNGDYCIYQQPAALYGGYDNEYFSISYWGDSDMVEFCLHCPLSETQSVNFYLRMRGGYNKEYEYMTSKYYRDTGVSFRSATGHIDPAVFSDRYPLSCDLYEGDFDGQNNFMEESRVGICDLIRCLKKFVEVENMECGFSAFDFGNF